MTKKPREVSFPDPPPGRCIYFASDCHLGIPDHEKSLEREKLFVRWLDSTKENASEIYLLGDIFDFWFEYSTVIPKGYTRLFGKIAELSDMGIKIHYFTGNHDMWMSAYVTKETGIELTREPVTRTMGGKKFLIGHGDGLGPGDHGYKFIKKIFANRICRWLFSIVHPGFGTRLALYFSRRSRLARGNTDEIFRGNDKERLLLHAKSLLEKDHYDYFIFGHRHLPLDIKLAENSRYINLGDWISNFTFGVWDGKEFLLMRYN